MTKHLLLDASLSYLKPQHRSYSEKITALFFYHGWIALSSFSEHLSSRKSLYKESLLIRVVSLTGGLHEGVSGEAYLRDEKNVWRTAADVSSTPHGQGGAWGLQQHHR